MSVITAHWRSFCSTQFSCSTELFARCTCSGGSFKFEIKLPSHHPRRWSAAPLQSEVSLALVDITMALCVETAGIVRALVETAIVYMHWEDQHWPELLSFKSCVTGDSSFCVTDDKLQLQVPQGTATGTPLVCFQTGALQSFSIDLNCIRIVRMLS